MSDLRFDVEAYRERLGEKAFARHQNYLNGEVMVLAIDGGGLVAHVEGSEGRTYVVEIGEGGFDFCSCPAFEEAGVCKHLPAVAAVANDLSPDEVRKLSRRLDRLRETLSFESQAALIERLVALAKVLPDALEILEGEADQD
jgi:uncharacterized Zn finger protein